METRKKITKGLAWILIIGMFFVMAYRVVRRNLVNSVVKHLTPYYMGIVIDEFDDELPPDLKEKADNIYNEMSNKDKSRMAAIVGNHISFSTISDVKNLIASGDKAALRDYAEKNLTKEEKNSLQQIYMKYIGNEILMREYKAQQEKEAD